MYRAGSMRTEEYRHTGESRTYLVLLNLQNKSTIYPDSCLKEARNVVILSHPFELRPDTSASGDDIPFVSPFRVSRFRSYE